MTFIPLTTYLRSLRVNLGLSMEEVAFLLGEPNHKSISRHECSCDPIRFRAMFAYETLYGVHARDIYPRHFRKAAQAVLERVGELIGRLQNEPPSPARDLKIEKLQSILVRGLEDHLC